MKLVLFGPWHTSFFFLPKSDWAKKRAHISWAKGVIVECKRKKISERKM